MAFAVSDDTSTSLFSAIRSGDLPALRRVFEGCTADEAQRILLIKHPEVLSIIRPNNDKQIKVIQPSPIIVAVCCGQSEIIAYLVSQSTSSIHLTCSVEDLTNLPHSYSKVSPLHLSAIRGDFNMTSMLIKNGSNINGKTSLGDTALMEACFEGHEKVLELLVQNGGDINIPNDRGATCLMIAAFADHADIVHLLTSIYVSKPDDETESLAVDINKVDKDSRNALFYTAAGGRADTLVHLIQHGANITTDKNEVSILMEAVHYNQTSLLKYIIEYQTELELDVHATDSCGRNVLFYTDEHTSINTLHYLIHTAEIMPKPANDGRTLLMVACLRNNSKMVNYLLDNREKLLLDVNERDDKGRNSLFYCVTSGNLYLLDILVENGVRMEMSPDGITLLMQAVAKNKLKLAEHLIIQYPDHGTSSVMSRDEDGWNSLMYAAAAGKLDMIKLLTLHGSISVGANDGRTPLMQSCFRGEITQIVYILDHAHELDVYVNERNNDEWNSLFYAVSGGHVPVMELLLQRGAHACIAKNGRNLLHEAVSRGQRDMVTYILNHLTLIELDLQGQDSTGADVLMLCTKHGDVSMFRQLVSAGCSPHSDQGGRNVLMMAVLQGHTELLQYLILHHVTLKLNLQHTDNNGCNALFYCIAGKQVELLEFLIRCDVKPETDNRGRTLLMKACEVGDMSVYNYVMRERETLGLTVNDLDVNGENCLSYAARNDHLELVQILLENNAIITTNHEGINVLAQSMNEGHVRIAEAILMYIVANDTNRTAGECVNGHDARGRTIFHHCVLENNLDLLRKLGHYYKGSLDGDVNGTTVLMLGCRYGTLSLVQYLMEKLKVDHTSQDHQGKDALCHAVEASQGHVVHYLLNQLDIGTFTEDRDGRNALMIAIQNRQEKITEMLLTAKHNRSLANRTDKRGRTAVHYCAMRLDEQQQSNNNNANYMTKKSCSLSRMIDLLKGYGADVNMADSDTGATPVMYACERADVLMLSVLLQRGARVNDKDATGFTALHYCFKASQPSLRCVRLLLHRGAEVNAVGGGSNVDDGNQSRNNNNNGTEDIERRILSTDTSPSRGDASDQCSSSSVGETPLMLASKTCAITNIPVITCLLNSGADPFRLDKQGRDCIELCPFDAQYVKAMIESVGEMPCHQQEALDIFSSQLLEILHLNSVLGGLIREKVFTRTLQFEVMKQLPHERIPKLLSLVRMRGRRAFHGFCEMLKGEMQYELAYGLQRAAYVRPVELFV